MVTFNTHGPSRSRQQAAAQSPTTFSRPRGSCLPSCHPRNGSLIYPAGRPAQEFAVPRCNGVVGSLLPSLPPSLPLSHAWGRIQHAPSIPCLSIAFPTAASAEVPDVYQHRPISSHLIPSFPIASIAMPRLATPGLSCVLPRSRRTQPGHKRQRHALRTGNHITSRRRQTLHTPHYTLGSSCHPHRMLNATRTNPSPGSPCGMAFLPHTTACSASFLAAPPTIAHASSSLMANLNRPFCSNFGGSSTPSSSAASTARPSRSPWT